MDILAILQEKLKEEQWTRASVVDQSGITILDNLITDIVKEDLTNQASDICLEFLKTSPRSVIALHIVGFCGFYSEDKENTLYLQNLIEALRENKKNSIAEHIAQKILKYDANHLYALQSLLQIYTETKNDKEKINILLNLLRVDVKNGQIPQKIAEYYEQYPDKSAKEASVSLPIKYYQLALRRYTKTQNTIKIEEIWKKLSHNPNNVNYFLNIAMMVSEYNSDLATQLLFSLVDVLEEHLMYNEGISILKRLLILDSENTKIRFKFTEIYKKKYAQSPQLSLSIDNSGIENPKIKLDTAIKKFEKEIQFTQSGYVSHQVWGVGTIAEITDDAFIIDFEGHPKHRMSYNMALNSLIPLSKDHIWVVKNSKEKLNPDTQIEEIILTVLKSFPNKNLSIDDLKGELVPEIVPVVKWNAWWNKAKNILKEHPSIGTIKEGRPKYYIRTISIAFDEEMIEKFQTSRRFDEKLKIIEQFIKEVHSLDEYADQFKEMVSYFELVVNSSSRYDFNDKILSLLLLQKLIKSNPWSVEEEILPVEEIMQNDKGLEIFLTSTYKVEYKRELTYLIIQYHSRAQGLLIDVLYSDNTQVADFIMEQLEKALSPEQMKEIISQGIEELFRENPIMTFWFLNYALQEERYLNLGMIKEELYSDILYRLNTVGKLQEQKNMKWFKNSPNSTEAKKIITLANDSLFKYSDFTSFILNHNTKKYVSSIYELIKVSTALNSKHKVEILKVLSEKLPTSSMEDLTSTSEVNYMSSDIIWSSHEGLDKQKKRLLDLEQERQANLVELESARDKGDLRENAEYQAAREKDTNLTNAISELGEQLKKAKVIDFTTISGEEVIPGTSVSINKDGKQENYTILGFWDTDESKKIIAYNSPLATAMISLKKGDKTTAEIGGDKVSIEILDINVFTNK